MVGFTFIILERCFFLGYIGYTIFKIDRELVIQGKQIIKNSDNQKNTNITLLSAEKNITNIDSEVEKVRELANNLNSGIFNSDIIVNGSVIPTNGIQMHDSISGFSKIINEENNLAIYGGVNNQVVLHNNLKVQGELCVGGTCATTLSPATTLPRMNIEGELCVGDTCINGQKLHKMLHYNTCAKQ